MLNLEELIPRCHNAAKANGWWENPQPVATLMMLTCSELAECLEADRAKKRADLQAYDRLVDEAEAGGAAVWGDAPTLEARKAELFKWKVKDTVEDELADAFIRLCDYAGSKEQDYLSAYLNGAANKSAKLFNPDRDLPTFLLVATSNVAEVAWCRDVDALDSQLGRAMGSVLAIAMAKDIDLARHIDLKLAYNATRGVRHGGKAY